MNTPRRALLALCALTGPLLLAGCGGEAASSGGGAHCTAAHPEMKTLTKGTLTLSVYSSKPYTDLDRPDGDLGGVDGEIVKRIAKMECLTLKTSPVSGAALIQSLQSKRADIAIGGVYRTADRAKILDLSSTMYRDGMAVLSKGGLTDLAGLNGQKVGVIQGYLWNAELQKALGSKNVKVFQDSNSLVADLKAGRLDAGILTSAESSVRVGDGLQAKPFTPDRSVPTSTKPGEVVIPSPKGNSSLSKALSSDIDTLIKDGSVAKILKANGMSTKLAGPGAG